MDFQRLAYFVAVAEHGSVSGAAAALHVAQPSLSQSIRALERDLGVTLFDRRHRGLALTPDGKALLDPARRVLDDLATARAAVRDKDVLTLAVHDMLAMDLGDVLAGLRTAHPDLSVRLVAPRNEDEIVRLLADGQCAAGLTYLPVRHPELRGHPLGARSVALILPPAEHDRPDPVPLRDLAGMAVVDTLRVSSAARTTIRAALAAHDVVMRPAVRSAHREAIVPLVLAGAGAAFVSGPYADEAARQGAVVRRLDPPIDVTYGLLFRAGPRPGTASLLLHHMARRRRR
ncbi:LysR family transcriptional regulator [Asanoa siamensis]|uniref:LysR family transcriptional regulator n=1 Tax=Asanoa siamensis TaxID=926357 RepID=A0ABQ4CQL5_9ACTN|nr:LysR family transcriptional regulator [Asanoa siamensis]GIF73591.1 LysR family transcriptional regulator [Asanoa siamensis]